MLKPKIAAFLHKYNISIHPALLIIDDDSADSVEIAHHLRQAGYQIIHTVYASKDNAQEKMSELLIHNHVQIIFLWCQQLVREKFGALPHFCRKNNIKLKIITPESKELLSLIKIYDITGIPLVLPHIYGIETIKKVFKRGLDIVGALFFLLLTSPIFLLLSILIKLESKGPVFFIHTRSLSPNGKKFKLYKFRSMVDNADDLKELPADKTVATDILFKAINDSRITRVGKIMRRFSLDELPQFFNVLKGDMSLVGPRPLPINDYQMISGRDVFYEFYNLRSQIKPGITGLWQISGRSNLSFKKMILLDLYYIENHNIFFDIQIIMSTIPAVIFGDGAY